MPAHRGWTLQDSMRPPLCQSGFRETSFDSSAASIVEHMTAEQEVPDCRRGLRRYQSRARRKSCALTATTIVLSDIRTAPSAGLNTTPLVARTPAARGIATTL